MTLSLILSLTVIALVTVGLMHQLRRHHLKAPATILVYGLVICGFVVGGHFYSRLQAQRVHDTCLNSVTRSLGNREQHLAIYTEIDALDDTEAQDVAERLRKALDVNLPARDASECDNLPAFAPALP